METLLIERRLTNKFVGTFRHLDSWETLGVIRHTPLRRVYEPARDERAQEDPSTGPNYVAFARLPAGANVTEWCDAIEDSLTSWGCSHEYDCCGCASHRASVKPYRGRVVRISVGVTYNY